MGRTDKVGTDAASASKNELQSLARPPDIAVRSRQLPVPWPITLRKAPHRSRRPVLVIAALGAIAVGYAYWWTHRTPPLPAAIAVGNGRIETDPIDIATKFAGRILTLLVDEGNRVSAGQILAVMDTRDLSASLKKAEALAEQARKSIGEARANLDQQHSQLVFAEQEMERSRVLLQKGMTTKEIFDQRR
jgi:HlyD family secretion protein